MSAEGVTKLRPQDWDCRRKPRAHVVPGQMPDDLIAGTRRGGQGYRAVRRCRKMVEDLKASVFLDRELRYVQVGAKVNEVSVA